MDYVKVEVKDGIAIVTLNKPPMNALTVQTYEEITTAFNSITDDEAINMAIFTAEGRAFISGNDVGGFSNPAPSNIIAQANVLKAAITAVYGCRVPVIAAVNGYCLGAGLAFAAVCDTIVASDKALFGIPEVKVGIVGAGGFLSMLVPPKVARYLAYTGNNLTAEEMKQYGGVHKVVPNEKLLETALEVAREYLKNAPLALQAWKKALTINEGNALVEKYDVEFGFSLGNMKTEDFKEGVTAFFEKRKPVYQGK